MTVRELITELLKAPSMEMKVCVNLHFDHGPAPFHIRSINPDSADNTGIVEIDTGRILEASEVGYPK